MKAFDKLEHHAISKILIARGFGQKWNSWIAAVLKSGTSTVLLNGVQGKIFHCKRGLRQGDPLSPLLFLHAVGLLQSVINEARNRGILNNPIPLNYTQDFLRIEYADDTLLVTESCRRQFWTLKALLQSFWGINMFGS